MAQFDLHQLKSGLLVVDLQTDLIGIDASRVVAPLRAAGRNSVWRDGSHATRQDPHAIPIASLRGFSADSSRVTAFRGTK